MHILAGWLALAFAAFLLQGVTTAQATEDITHCDKELVPTVVNSNASIVLRMFASRLVTDDNYQQIKNDLNSSGGYGLAWGSADAHTFQEQNNRQRLIALLPVRSTSCRGGAAARWRCRARTGMLHVGYADG